MGRAIYNNSYFALRHGTSTANEAGIVVADPANGVSGYGLSPDGRTDTRARLETAMTDLRFRPGSTLCFSSDFLRALETAEIFCDILGRSSPRIDERLRERFFGELELGPNTGYDEIWARDLEDPDHHHRGCASPREVAARVRSLLEELEENLAGQTIVFVSHGDTLQITQTIFHGMEPHLHRSLPHLENAELRRLDPMT